MALNGISTTGTKEERQIAKLDLVALKRQGNVLNSDGTVYSTPLGSAQFSGSNYLSVAGGSGTAMGTGDFTWECWVYPTSSSDYQAFIDTRTNPLAGGDNTGFYFGTNFDTLAPIYYTDGLQLASTETITLNAWNHVALTRNSGTVTLWVNGASGGTQSNATDLTEQRVFIGGAGLGAALNLTGNISNLRIVKGQALYTNNFTPPTSTLTAVAGTQLLLLNGTTEFVDGSNNQFTITNEGSVTLLITAPTLTISAPFYRTRATYDITQLPNLYNDNGIDPDENPNTGGLVQGRPWVELAAGLYRRTYSGYFNDDVNWFATATQTAAVADSTLAIAATPETTSIQWLGYFVPATTETYTFYTSSDDASYLWIGANAVAGFTTGNALVNNGGTHGVETASGSIALTAGVRYAIRIQTGNGGGPGAHATSFSTPTIAQTTTFTNRIFYNPIVNGL
jgi:hypothetical protein